MAGSNLFSLFQIRLENWFKIEFIFAKNLNIVPTDLDKMEFYRVEYLLHNYEEFIEEENKQNKKQQADHDKSMSSSNSSMNIPKMDIPKMNIPGM